MGIRAVEKWRYWLPGWLMLVFAAFAGTPRSALASLPPSRPDNFQAGTAGVDTALAEDRVNFATSVLADEAPDSSLEVPWNGVLWEGMPDFTWAACDVGPDTRRAIDIAVGQWSYAATNQGLPIRLSETPCVDGTTDAQIRIYTASVSNQLGSPDRDFFGVTLTRGADNRLCGVVASVDCIAQVSRVYLFPENWKRHQLTYAQAAKTVAHEIGHAIGLGHAHFCNFDSIMVQNCEPILQGLGPADIESLDALIDYVRAYFGQPALGARPIEPPASGGGSTVTYHAGYNLVAGPRGTSFSAAAGPLYTLTAGDALYRTIPETRGTYASYGYWAYFSEDVAVQLSGDGGSFYAADAPPGTWFLLGNDSGKSPMRVIGAIAVYVFDPFTGQYRSTDILEPGRAAWVMADTNGEVLVASTSLTDEQIRCYVNLGSPLSCNRS